MRIDNTNINQYLNTNIFQSKQIIGIQPLLQNDYGEANDCTLTSLTTIIGWLKPKLTIYYIYNNIEKIAKKYGYDGTRLGINPLFIKTICNNASDYFNLKQKFNSKYGKGICYNYNFIKNQIIMNKPIILNLWKDGNNYYNNHSVLIVGFCETNNKKMLIVYDNWSLEISYIDYDKLSIISSIVYML